MLLNWNNIEKHFSSNYRTLPNSHNQRNNMITLYIAARLVSRLSRPRYFETNGGSCMKSFNLLMHDYLALMIISKACRGFNQHHLKTRPAHRNVETSQTSEIVGMAPKNCNSYPDAIFKLHH